MRHFMGKTPVRDLDRYQDNSSESPVLRNLDFFQSIQVLTQDTSITTIFDVGGNAGDFSWEFLQLFPDAKIHCFEPSPVSYQSLTHRFKGNSKIDIHNIAVSDREGTSEFYCYKENPTDSLFMPATQWRQWVDGKSDALDMKLRITVPTTSLDTFCSINSISEIDILKIDT